MPITSRAVVLGTSASLVSASPALGADAGMAAISATGGALALVGLALIGLGSYALMRPRSPSPRFDSLAQAEAESAATDVQRRARSTKGAAAAGNNTASYRGATVGISDEVREHAYAGASGSATPGADDVQALLAKATPLGANADATISDRDAIAKQMLEALKAEQARRSV